MYDIIPDGGERNDRPARPIRRSVGKKSQQRKVVYAGPRTVQLQWKLPSRLRKPIRQQLAKQRAEKHRRAAAAVSFARKPIHTQPLLVANTDTRRQGARVQKPRRFFNRGAEHNTGDVYSQGKPDLHVAAPPYIGAIARRQSASKQSSKPVVHKAARRSAQKQAISNGQAPVRRRPARQSRMPVAERDIPMQWNSSTQHSAQSDDGLYVAASKPRGVMPGVTFSLWPGNWFGGRSKERVVSASKKKRLIS